MKKEVDGMGVPDVKYGDSVCFIQHVFSCQWLTYQTVDAKCARMGGVQRKVWMRETVKKVCFFPPESLSEYLYCF